jgi:hypothetical protein
MKAQEKVFIIKALYFSALYPQGPPLSVEPKPHWVRLRPDSENMGPQPDPKSKLGKSEDSLVHRSITVAAEVFHKKFNLNSAHYRTNPT